MNDIALKVHLFWIEFTTAGIEACTRRMLDASKSMRELEAEGGRDSLVYACIDFRYHWFDFLGAVCVALSHLKGEGE